MPITPTTDKMSRVTDPSDSTVHLLEERGRRIRERIAALGLDTAKAARLANMSRTTAYKVLEGTASATKVADLERALDDYEANPADAEFGSGPQAIQSTEEGMIEIELDDVTATTIGRIVVRGHESDALVDRIMEIVRRVRENDGP